MAKKPQRAPTKAKAAPKAAPAKTAPAKPAKQEFVLKRGDGNVVFKGFDPEKDRITFDYGSAAEIMFDGPVTDNMNFTNPDRTATWHIRAMDGDTLITVDADTALLVKVTPDQLSGWNFRSI